MASFRVRANGVQGHAGVTHEKSLCPPQTVASMAQWDTLVRNDVIGEFERAEVETFTKVNLKDDAEMKALFQDAQATSRPVPVGAKPQAKARAQARNALLEKTDKIRDESKFKAFTPASEQNLCAELQFLRVLHEGDLWHKANDCWVTGFLPPGGLVRIKSTNETLFVLKTYWCSALCWPAEQESEGVWRKARECGPLVWRTVFDADDVEVIPVQWKSPVRMFLEDGGRARALSSSRP